MAAARGLNLWHAIQHRRAAVLNLPRGASLLAGGFFGAGRVVIGAG